MILMHFFLYCLYRYLVPFLYCTGTLPVQYRNYDTQALLPLLHVQVPSTPPVLYRYLVPFLYCTGTLPVQYRNYDTQALLPLLHVQVPSTLPVLYRYPSCTV